MSQANDQKVDAGPAGGWLFIAHSERRAVEPASITWCYSAADILEAVKSTVWDRSHVLDDDEGAQAEAIAVTLMTEGEMRFEGDPSLQLVRVCPSDLPLQPKGFSQWLLVGKDERVAGHSPIAIDGAEDDYARRFPASAPFRWVEMVERHERPEVSLAPADADVQRDAGPAAWRDVLAERRRQIEAEGWSPEHDDEHDVGDLAKAAACYAIAVDGFTPGLYPPRIWPWDASCFKPTTTRRNLIKAGALILAEIERLDRAAISRQSEQKGGER